MPRTVLNGGKTLDRTPEIQISLTAPLPQGSILRVLRDNVILGNATEITPISYTYTDPNAPLGIAVYRLEVERLGITSDSPTYTIVIANVPVVTIPEVVGTTVISNGGQTTDTSLTVGVSLDAPMPPIGIVNVFRNSTLLGMASLVSNTNGLLYTFTDTAGLGVRIYTANAVITPYTSDISSNYSVEVTNITIGPELFLDTFSTTTSVGLPAYSAAPEVGNWIENAEQNLVVKDGLLRSTIFTGRGQTNNFQSPDNAYTLTLEFIIDGSTTQGGDFSIHLGDATDFGDYQSGDLRATIRFRCQNNNFQEIYTRVSDDNTFSYGNNNIDEDYPDGFPTIDNFSSMAPIATDIIHTLTMEIAPNYYNFKLNNTNLSTSGAFTQSSLSFVNPRIDIEVEDSAENQNSVFAFTSLKVINGIDTQPPEPQILMLRLNAEQSNINILDSSTYTRTINGTALVSTDPEFARAGNNFMEFNGNMLLTIPPSEDFDFGALDFSIKFSVYKFQNNIDFSRIWDANADILSNISIIIDGSGELGIYMSTDNVSWTYAFPSIYPLNDNIWYEIAVVRYDTELLVFINGKKLTVSSSIDPVIPLMPSSTLTRSIGGQSAVPSRNLFGYLDNFEVYKNAAVHVQDYSVDPNYKFVSLLMHFNGGEGSEDFLDESRFQHVITSYNAYQAQEFQSFGISSGRFDTASVYVEPNATAFEFGEGDFTIEFDVVHQALSSLMGYIQSDAIGSSTADKWWVGHNGTHLVFSAHAGGPSMSTPLALTINDTYTIVCTRKSGVTRIYINGELEATSSAFDGYYFSQNGIAIGGISTPAFVNANIDNLRISRVGRYTGPDTYDTVNGSFPFPTSEL